MTELKDLIERRDATVKQLTDAIIKSIPNVATGAEWFIRHREGRSGQLIWEDITYYEDQDFIMLTGVLEYSEGDVIELPNGVEYEVTKDTREQFKRLLRLGIPYDLATLGTEEDVIEFLITSAEEAEDVGEPIEASEELERALAHLQAAESPDFDVDALSDEQREQLKLFNLTSGGK